VRYNIFQLITTGEVVTLDPPVQGEQEVVIYVPISVVPAILVFPWIPVSGEYYRYQLKATGGSGRYSWTSDETNIASVNTRGLLTTTTDTGMTEVKAHDSENSMHYGLAQVRKFRNCGIVSLRILNKLEQYWYWVLTIEPCSNFQDFFWYIHA
jgi:hypothetical protein